MYNAKTLTLLQRHAQSQRRAAARAWQERRAETQEQLRLQARLQGYRTDYTRRLEGALGLPSTLLRDEARFVSQLDEALEQLGRRIVLLTAREEAARDAWRRHRQRTRLLEVLQERARLDVARARQRREQARQDEHAAHARWRLGAA
jgi:flagellar export protein FliJ